MSLLACAPGRRSPSGRVVGPHRWAIALLLVTLVAPTLRAADAYQATSSRAARREALEAIPLAELSDTNRKLVLEVVNNTTIFRRMPTTVVDCDPRMFHFLVRHPEVIVDIWDVLGISKVTLDRTGENTFRASDGQGTLGKVTMLHDAYDRQLIYAEGAYEGPLFRRPVRAKCVLLLRSGSLRETNGRYYVTARLDAFIQLERVGVELLAKTFQPLVGRAADYNFTETMAFIGSLSRTAELKPRGVEHLAGKLTDIQPEVRRRFVAVSRAVSERAARDRARRSNARSQRLARRDDPWHDTSLRH